MLLQSRITVNELAAARRLVASQTKNRAEMFNEYLDTSRIPPADTAFWIGEQIGVRVPYVSGITGLYAAGYIAEVIRLENELIPRIGSMAVGLILGSLPLIVDLPASRDGELKDVEIALFISKSILSRDRSQICPAWILAGKYSDFKARYRTEIDFEMLRYCRIARTLEDSKVHEASDVRDTCFRGVLRTLRRLELEAAEPEMLINAFDWHSRGDGLHPFLKRSAFYHALDQGGNVEYRVRSRSKREKLIALGKPPAKRAKKKRKEVHK